MWGKFNMKLRNVVKITGKVLRNELKIGRNFKNENCIFGYLVIEVSKFSVVKVNITIGEFTNFGKRDSRYDAMLKAVTLKSKASVGDDTDTIQITSGFLQTKVNENTLGMKKSNIEIRTNFISIIEGSRANQSQFEFEGFLDRIQNNIVVIKQLNYSGIMEEFRFTSDNRIIEELKKKIGNIVLVKGKVEKTANVVQYGTYMIATTPSTDKFYIEQLHESTNNTKENIDCFTE